MSKKAIELLEKAKRCQPKLRSKPPGGGFRASVDKMFASIIHNSFPIGSIRKKLYEACDLLDEQEEVLKNYIDIINKQDEVYEAKKLLQAKLDEKEEELQIYKLLEENSWDLRCIDIPTGGDDYDIEWIVIEHHMAS